jgi:hypothetical protein
LNKAVVLGASIKTRAAAAELYQQLGDCPWLEPAARQQAWFGAIDALRILGHWRELISAAQMGSADFPAVGRIYRDEIDEAKQNVAKTGS